MSKGRAKPGPKPTNQAEKAPQSSFTMEQITQAIVNAELRLKKLEVQQKNEHNKQLREKIGFCEPEDVKRYGKIRCCIKDFAAFFKVITFPSKYMPDTAGITMLMNLILTLVLEGTAIVLHVLAVFFLVYPLIINRLDLCGLTLIFAVLSLLIGRLLYMATIEVLKIQDRITLTSVFSAVVSFSALIVSLVALVNTWK